MSETMWWLAGGIGLLAFSGGFATGKKAYGPSAALKRARKSASARMDQIDDFMARLKQREKEIRPGRLLHSAAKPMTAAEKTYWKSAYGEAVNVAKDLRRDHAQLTKPQLGRLRKKGQALAGAALVAPTVLKQAEIGVPKLEELVPSQQMLYGTNDPYQGGGQPGGGGPAPGQPAPRGGAEQDLVNKFGAVKEELYKKHNGDKSKIVAELKLNHAALLAEVKQKVPKYWNRQLDKLKGLD